MDFNLLASLICEKTTPQKLVVIYPGRFHPFHKGHASVFKHLEEQYPKADVYVATSEKVEQPKSPFTFDQKAAMMVAAGIPRNKIVAVKNPYVAIEITSKYNPKDIAVIFAVSQKDMITDPRFSFKPKRDGSASYFQPLGDVNQVESADTHGYIKTVDTKMFKIAGHKITSASQIRQLYKESDDQTRQQIIADLYGKFDKNVYAIFNAALLNGHR